MAGLCRSRQDFHLGAFSSAQGCRSYVVLFVGSFSRLLISNFIASTLPNQLASLGSLSTHSFSSLIIFWIFIFKISFLLVSKFYRTIQILVPQKAIMQMP